MPLAEQNNSIATKICALKTISYYTLWYQSNYKHLTKRKLLNGHQKVIFIVKDRFLHCLQIVYKFNTNTNAAVVEVRISPNAPLT